jgi:hypothetical protein
MVERVLLFGFLPWAMLLGLRVRRILSLPAIPLLVSALLSAHFWNSRVLHHGLCHSCREGADRGVRCFRGPGRPGQPARVWPDSLARAGLIFGAFYAILHFAGYLARAGDRCRAELGRREVQPLSRRSTASARHCSARASFGGLAPHLRLRAALRRFESLAELGWLYATLAILAIGHLP